MSEWKKTIISDIADFNTRSVNKDFKFDVIEYIDTSSVEKGQLTNTQEILLKEAPSRAKRRIQKNDILISSVRPNLEHYYFVDKCKENTVVSTGFVVITPKKDTYPYFLLTTEQYTQYLTQVANSHTSTYPSFNPEVIENSILSIPDYPEQKQIADVLSCLDAKIENLRRQNETLEQIAQTLFRHWFIDFEFPNADAKPYKSSGGAMFASDLGDIPEGWNFGELGEFTDISIGRTPPRKDIEWFSTNPKDIKWVSIRDMGNCGIYIVNTSEYLTQEAIDKFNIPVIPEDTVILSFKLTVGRVAITTEQMLSNEAIAHIKLIDNYLNTEYLYLFLKQYNFSFLGSTSSIATAVNSKSIIANSRLVRYSIKEKRESFSDINQHESIFNRLARKNNQAF